MIFLHKNKTIILYIFLKKFLKHTFNYLLYIVIFNYYL